MFAIGRHFSDMARDVRVESVTSCRRRPIFLISTPPNNHQAFIRQRSLQRLGFIPWRAHPYVAFLVGR
jgi:hypothetical protein